MQYCELDVNDLPIIGEVNKDKIGCFTPGTSIPIVSQEDVINKNPDYFFILPWHFKKFFLENNKFKGKKLVFPLPSLEIIQL